MSILDLDHHRIVESRRRTIQERIEADIEQWNTGKVNEANGTVQEEKPDAIKEENHVRDNPITENQSLNRGKRNSKVKDTGRRLG